MDKIFVIHLYVRYVINVLLIMSFAKDKKIPTLYWRLIGEGCNRMEAACWILNTSEETEYILRIGHIIYGSRVQFAGWPIKIFLLQKYPLL